MNAFASSALWCIVQVTLLAAFVALWCLLLRRSNPATRSLAVFTGLVLIVTLTLLAASPWPAWSIASLDRAPRQASPPPAAVVPSEDSPVVVHEPLPPAIETEHGSERAPGETSSATALLWRSFLAEVEPSPPSTTRTGWSWRELILGAVGVGAAIGLIRLLAGLMLVRTYRARSRWVGDQALLEVRDVLQAELNCKRYVALYESELLTTAATIGWREPLVILPAGWRDWTDDERRAVLAHEIAHIARHDFPTWVAAQMALVLHFYHPLVHWLCRNLRLEQELAADAAAAALAGGQQAYLTTLAAMALRQPDRPLAWPARTFLPTRGTFMRRIEMLRDGKLRSTSASAGTRMATVVVLAAAGLFIAGLRGTAAPSDPAQAATVGALALSQAGATEPTGLEWVPRDALVVATIRPAKILARPELAGIAAAIQQQGQLKEQMGVSPDRIEQLSLVLLGREVQGGGGPQPAVGIVMRLTQPAEAAAFLKGALPEATPAEYAGRKYVVRQGGSPQCGFTDDRTVVLVEDEPMLRRMIVSGTTGASLAKWATGWNTVAGDDAAAIVNIEGLRSMADQALRQGLHNPLAVVAPLWQNANSLILGLKPEQKNFFLRGRLVCGSPEDAKRVKDTLSAVVTIARNGISGARGSAAQIPGQQGAMLLGAADIVDAMLDTAEVTQKDREVEFSLTLRAEQAAIAGSLLAPAVTEVRGAARQTQAMNNLKQLALGMHVYHEQKGAFPPAVIIGPDGKTPHSWRVALLPFIEQGPLYNQYDLNQPWDSETNKKVLAQIPAVFRDPSEPSTNASYFVLTGPDTIFSGAQGTKIFEVTDGTSNTLMFVEAKRAVPWTKPEDIAYAADKPVPQLGGYRPDGFLAAMADGSVRVIGKMVDEKILRGLITKAGGEIPPKF